MNWKAEVDKVIEEVPEHSDLNAIRVTDRIYEYMKIYLDEEQMYKGYYLYSDNNMKKGTIVIMNYDLN